MCQWRPDDAKFQPIADVRDAPLNGGKQDLDTLLLVCFVLLRTGGEFLPWLIGFASRGVDLDDVLALRTECFDEDGWNEERAEILGVLEGLVPVLSIRVICENELENEE